MKERGGVGYEGEGGVGYEGEGRGTEIDRSVV